MSSHRSQHPKVFISYSWDSQTHKDIVLDLADRLRIHGIDCNIDQYEVSPSEGWLNWMHDQVEQADFVLLICTEKYCRRYRGKRSSSQGKGVVWEGAIISQFIYEQVSNTKFIPVIFAPQAEKFIPYELKRYTHYLLNQSNFNLEESGYEALYRHLTNQSHQKSSLGDIVSLPPRRPYPVGSSPEIKKVDGIDKDLIRDEQERRRLNSLYQQAKENYQQKNWFAAHRKFQKILSFSPRDSDFQQRVERRIWQTREQIANEKKLSIVFIMASWIFSVLLTRLLPIEYTNVIGGFFSGIIIWWISQGNRQLEESKKLIRLLLFIFIGVFVELLIWQFLGTLQNDRIIPNDFFLYLVTVLIGSAISTILLSWQINQRMNSK